MLLIRNGRVIDPHSKTDAKLDVLIDGERISRNCRPGSASAGGMLRFLTRPGLIVAPGFIDMHVHLREPGQENSETIETGTLAAARGGFTAAAIMPNTKPVNDNAAITRFIVDRAKAHGHVRVWPIGAASVGSKGEVIADIAAMRDAGIVAVSDDGKPIATAKLARQVMDYCRSLELPVIEHAEDVSLAAGASMREGLVSTRLGLAGMPSRCRISLRGERCPGCRIDRRSTAYRASLREGFARSGSLREGEWPARNLRGDPAPFHPDR